MRLLGVVACLLAGLVAAATARAQAGYFAKEFGTDVEKVIDKAKLDMMSTGRSSDSGSGPKPYLPALGGPPKRIALLSYYSLDIGNEKETGPYVRAATGWYSHRSISVTGEGLTLINRALYDAGIPAMKEGFAAHGMELLSVDEYLDTAEKRAAYEAFQLDTGGKGGVTTFLNKLAKAGFKLTEPAPGYRLIDLPRLNVSNEGKFGLSLQGGSGPVFEGLGHDLAKALGVDAVMIAYNVLRAEKNGINLIGAYAYVFGPNPLPDKSQGPYWKGHQYAGAFLKLDVPLTQSKGGDVNYDFDGSAIVARAVAERNARRIVDEIAGR